MQEKFNQFLKDSLDKSNESFILMVKSGVVVDKEKTKDGVIVFTYPESYDSYMAFTLGSSDSKSLCIDRLKEYTLEVTFLLTIITGMADDINLLEEMVQDGEIDDLKDVCRDEMQNMKFFAAPRKGSVWTNSDAEKAVLEAKEYIDEILQGVKEAAKEYEGFEEV